MTASSEWLAVSSDKTGENSMFGRTIVCLLLTVFLHTVSDAQPAKIARIGFLGATSASIVADRTEAFREGLRELGYQEGKNIVIDWRYADGNFQARRRDDRYNFKGS
jgi:hypothetical protein